MNAAKISYQVAQAKAVAAKLHLELVRAGRFYQAWNVLSLVRSGNVKLFNGNQDWELGSKLEDLGFSWSCALNGRCAIYFLRIKGE